MIINNTLISIEEAKKIAEEKINYKQEKIEEMEYRQSQNFSKKRQILINKMERANPLRRITDEGHAQAILIASDRHNNTDYDFQLEQAREKVEYGELDHAEVREYARTHMK